MPRRLFDFLCEQGHTTEGLVDTEVSEITCKVCGEAAKRLISAPRVNLEPFSGAFPGAYHAWNRKRAEKLAQDRKKADS
jgi:hypothetical protein